MQLLLLVNVRSFCFSISPSSRDGIDDDDDNDGTLGSTKSSVMFLV